MCTKHRTIDDQMKSNIRIAKWTKHLKFEYISKKNAFHYMQLVI